MNDQEHKNAHSHQTFKLDDLAVELNCRGLNTYTKASYPVKYGLFSRLETREYIFEFNLNDDIIQAKSKQKDWIHPSEWLKRTMGNDWVYYSTGGYSGVFEAIGEYYLPNLTYPTNSLLGGKPFEHGPVRTIANHWPDILSKISGRDMPEPFSRWLNRVQSRRPEDLKQTADRLFQINGARVTVMPPDARHVDYHFIPITISDGCLYKCRFCEIKNKKPFSIRSRENIFSQIRDLKKLYNKDLVNYNAIFLGEHDALNTPFDLIIQIVRHAVYSFELDRSYMQGSCLFMFASADSLLQTPTDFFKQLGSLGLQTFINVGLESYDPETLEILGKPITSRKVGKAFEKMQAINDRFPFVEITCNFVMDKTLPESHTTALASLLRERVSRPRPKGAVYLSPLTFSSPSREALYDFYKLKLMSRFPTYLYIIQRL